MGCCCSCGGAGCCCRRFSPRCSVCWLSTVTPLYRSFLGLIDCPTGSSRTSGIRNSIPATCGSTCHLRPPTPTPEPTAPATASWLDPVALPHREFRCGLTCPGLVAAELPTPQGSSATTGHCGRPRRQSCRHRRATAQPQSRSVQPGSGTALVDRARAPVPGTANPDDIPPPPPSTTAPPALPAEAAPAGYGGAVGPVGSQQERGQLGLLTGHASVANQLLLGPLARGMTVSADNDPAQEPK